MLIGEQTRLWGINPTLSRRVLSSETNQSKKMNKDGKMEKKLVRWHFNAKGQTAYLHRVLLIQLWHSKEEVRLSLIISSHQNGQAGLEKEHSWSNRWHQKTLEEIQPEHGWINLCSNWPRMDPERKFYLLGNGAQICKRNQQGMACFG